MGFEHGQQLAQASGAKPLALVGHKGDDRRADVWFFPVAQVIAPRAALVVSDFAALMRPGHAVSLAPVRKTGAVFGTRRPVELQVPGTVCEKPPFFARIKTGGARPIPWR